MKKLLEKLAEMWANLWNHETAEAESEVVEDEDKILRDPNISQPQPQNQPTQKCKRVLPLLPVLPRLPRISILIPMLLLALRHFAPEVAEEIPYVYQVLDEIVIPLIEWVCKLGLKVFEGLQNAEWFAGILEFFANLAA